MLANQARTALRSQGKQIQNSVRLLASTSSKDETIGFIGLGNMGSGMAKNLVEKGRKVVGFDAATSGSVLKETIGDGFTWASCPAEVAEQTHTVVTMLPNNDIVKAVYAGNDGVFTTVQGGTLLVDCSTIDPMVAKSMSDLAKEKSATFCDAPVSGGVNAAAVNEKMISFLPSLELKYTFNEMTAD